MTNYGTKRSASIFEYIFISYIYRINEKNEADEILSDRRTL
jgi:hypothetical protein